MAQRMSRRLRFDPSSVCFFKTKAKVEARAKICCGGQTYLEMIVLVYEGQI